MPIQNQISSEAVSSRTANLHLNGFSTNFGGNWQPIFHRGLNVHFDGLSDIGHRFFFVHALRDAALKGRAVRYEPRLTTFFDYDRILHGVFLVAGFGWGSRIRTWDT